VKARGGEISSSKSETMRLARCVSSVIKKIRLVINFVINSSATN
jgi:hypothetical protein